MQFFDGKITANDPKAQYEGYALAYTTNTLQGMSGGPVLNEDGKVVGIHGNAGLDFDEKFMGFNVGIPINTFLKLSVGKDWEPPVPSQNPTTASTTDDFFIQCKFKIEESNYQGAIADCSQALSRNPNNANVYYNRGLAHYSIGDMQKAGTDFQQAASLAKQQGNTDLYQKAYNRLRALLQ